MKLEIPIKLDIERRIEGARAVGDHKTSTLQDFENKKPLEIDALIKSLIELGKLTKIIYSFFYKTAWLFKCFC